METQYQRKHRLDEETIRVGRVLTAGGVERFHAVPSITGQTVGNHVYGVVALGAYICQRPRADFLVACLLHDSAELETGDIPFTAKRGCFKHLREALEEAEAAVMAESMWSMPPLTPAEEIMLKLADMLEGMRYVRDNERGEHPIVADRWWHALQDVLADPETREHLEHEQLERAYALFRRFAPAIHLHRCYTDFISFAQARGFKYEVPPPPPPIQDEDPLREMKPSGPYQQATHGITLDPEPACSMCNDTEAVHTGAGMLVPCPKCSSLP